MTSHSISPLLALAAALTSCGLALLPGLAWGEKSDRNQPMVVEADRDGVVDLQRRVVVYAGNAVVTQGTMVLRAERIEMREMADGYRAASAIGGAGKVASWRQRRDGIDEVVDGSADRIDFDGRADTLRFIGNGTVRRLRAGVVADEITGATIVWDNTTEIFKVEGGAASTANPTGRVRAVLSPRPQAAPSAGPAPASASASAAAPAAPALQPSRVLEERR